MYRFILLCLVVASAAACGETSTANTPPMASAGFDSRTVTGQKVYLDGTGSTDPDGDGLTFLWTAESAPAGSTAALDDVRSPNPAFTPDKAGLYVFGLIVSDGSYTSLKDLVSVTVAEAGK